MKIKRIALATGRGWADLTPDDRLLLKPLHAAGIEAETAVWDDPKVAWQNFDGVLIRSCWDYSWRLAEFLGWIAKLEQAEVPLWNPPAVVRENLDKQYLRTLENAGIDIVPTAWVSSGEAVDLGDLLLSRAWSEVVVKPTVSAGARDTWRLSREEAAERQNSFRELTAQGGVLVQPFLPEICSEGEWSLIFLGGRFSHAVVKSPVSGDFRVQEQYGGTAARTDPPLGLLDTAARALEVLHAGECLYARVDGVRSGEQFLIMEVELTEPRLFLAEDPRAPLRLARGVAATLGLEEGEE